MTALREQLAAASGQAGAAGRGGRVTDGAGECGPGERGTSRGQRPGHRRQAGRLTSHDVVARIRRLAGTRRVGHAGTLDPMATGVLVVGVEKATRLLGHLALTEKEYTATIRLGQATDTDDADGEIIAETSAAGVSRGRRSRRAAAALTGEIQQVPPGFSAIKVGGKRAYRLAREGAAPELAARTVTVSAFDHPGRAAPRRPARRRRHGDLLQRDLHPGAGPRPGRGARRGRPPHRAAAHPGGPLRDRRRPAPWISSRPRSPMIPLAEAARRAFRRLDLTERGRPPGRARAAGCLRRSSAAGPGPVAAFAPDGTLIALLTEEDGQARPLAVFVP